MQFSLWLRNTPLEESDTILDSCIARALQCLAFFAELSIEESVRQSFGRSVS